MWIGGPSLSPCRVTSQHRTFKSFCCKGREGGGWGGGEGLRARRQGTPTKEGEGDFRTFQGFLIGDFSQCLRCYGTPQDIMPDKISTRIACRSGIGTSLNMQDFPYNSTIYCFTKNYKVLRGHVQLSNPSPCGACITVRQGFPKKLILWQSFGLPNETIALNLKDTCIKLCVSYQVVEGYAQQKKLQVRCFGSD